MSHNLGCQNSHFGRNGDVIHMLYTVLECIHNLSTRFMLQPSACSPPKVNRSQILCRLICLEIPFDHLHFLHTPFYIVYRCSSISLTNHTCCSRQIFNTTGLISHRSRRQTWPVLQTKSRTLLATQVDKLIPHDIWLHGLLAAIHSDRLEKG